MRGRKKEKKKRRRGGKRKYSAIDHTQDGEEVEHLHAHAPTVGISELLLTLVIETVDLSDLTTLVVAAEENDLVGISGEKRR